MRASATKYVSLDVNARPAPVGASPRGWIVTGAMSTPAMAVDTKSRPAGSSRNATGAPVTSQAASQTATRASSVPASARATRPTAPIPRAWSRSMSLNRRRSRSLLSRSSSEASTRASIENSCSSASVNGSTEWRSAASEPTRVPSDSSSGTPR